MPSRPANGSISDLIERYALILRDEGIPIAERILYGVELWRAVIQGEKSLESLKSALRALAYQELKGRPGTVSIEGKNSTLGVVHALPSVPKIQGEINLEEARRVLGSDFDSVFQVSVILRPKAMEILDSLPDEPKKFMSTVIRMVDDNPRVSLQIKSTIPK